MDDEERELECKVPRPLPSAPFNGVRLALWIVLAWMLGGTVLVLATHYFGSWQ